jgi:hypothetical protein
MKLLETINLALEQSNRLDINQRQGLKQNLTELRSQVISNANLEPKEEEFYFKAFDIQTENIELNKTLNIILKLFCTYLSTSIQIDNTLQK